MKNILLFISFLFCIKATAQPDIKHSIYFKDKKCVKKGLDNYYSTLIYHSSGSVFASKNVLGTGLSGDDNVILYKLNAQYDTIWTKPIGGSENDRIYYMFEMPNNNILLVGETGSNDGDVPYGHTYSAQEIWLVEIDQNGTIIKGKTFGGSNGSNVFDVILSKDNMIYLAGQTIANDYDFVHVNYGLFDVDAWVAKLDTSFNLVWVKMFTGNSDEGATSISEISGNKFVVGISTVGTDAEMLGAQGKGGTDMLIYALDSAKNTVWAKRYGGSGYDGSGKSCYDSITNSIYMVGTSYIKDQDIAYQTGDTNQNCWVLKLDTLGNILQSKSYGDAGKQGLPGMYIVDVAWHDNKLWLVAFTQGGGGDLSDTVLHSPGSSYTNAWIGLVDSNANLVGKYTFRLKGFSYPHSFQSWMKNNYELVLNLYISSYTNTYSCDTSVSVNILFKIGLAPLGIEDLTMQPEIIFCTLYPNPEHNEFNLFLKEEINIGVNMDYIIKDVNGNILRKSRIKNKRIEKIDCSAWASGQYYISIKQGTKTQTLLFTKL